MVLVMENLNLGIINHTNSFSHRHHEQDTELSKHIWKLKDKGIYICIEHSFYTIVCLFIHSFTYIYIFAGGLTMFLVIKRLLEIKYGFESSISNVDLGLF